jgi:hypothetical protein
MCFTAEDNLSKPRVIRTNLGVSSKRTDFNDLRRQIARLASSSEAEGAFTI